MLLVDIYEPDDILRLAQQSVPAERAELNQNGLSDYIITDVVDGKTRQFSRKQAGELLSDIDEAERQLRNYYDRADENYQLVEGIISPVKLGLVKQKSHRPSVRLSGGKNILYSYSVAGNGYVYGEREHLVPESLLQAWLFRLQECGIYTIFTTNMVSTATTLAAIHNNCNKPEASHTILNRYIKPRVVIKEYNPLVLALMSLSSVYGIGIGEEKAKNISEKYSNLLDIINTDVVELCKVDGIGKVLANKLLVALRG
jgi:hypothetical protein